MATFNGVPSSLRACIIKDIQLVRVIGRGAHGRILEAKWEGSVVAVKQIHTTFEEVNAQEFEILRNKFLMECDRSNRLRHPNIVRFFGIYFPSGARIPNLVMERLHCSLNDMLERNHVIHLDMKMSILHQITLGLRYLHTRAPPIIHRDLSSKNVLISKGMEAKIADLGTIRLLDPNKNSPMSIAPGTQDFMPPEVLVNDPGIKYGKELDVFSFGCVMLHTFSQQWPTPSQHVVTDPVKHTLIARSEIERRAQYIDKVHKVVEDIMVPMIVSCLENIPFDRPSIMEVCDQLETLVVNREQSIPDNLLQAQLMLQEVQSQVERQTTELHDKDVEMEALRSDMSKMQVTVPHLPPKQVNKSSSDFWNNLKITWQQCADLPRKFCVTAVAELDGNVYVSGFNSDGTYTYPFMYDSNKDRWSTLPNLSCNLMDFSLVTVTGKKQLLAIGGRMIINGVVEISNKVFLWDDKYKKWLTPYPNMPTARLRCSSVSHKLKVIVAGGITSIDPFTMARSVEVLHINDNNLHDSYWSVVEQLPHVVCAAIPLIVNDNLYIAVGCDEKHGPTTCNVVTASLPELLQSSNNNTSSSQVWSKLPDMPYSSPSINHYQGHLITFTAGHMVEQPDEDKPVMKLVPLIHIYNPDTKTWDCVGDIPSGYLLCASVHIRENKILFVGGMSGTHDLCKDDDLMTTCSILTFTPQ